MPLQVICQVYEFDSRSVGSFIPLIDEIRKARTKKERAKFTTMISGFVRSMQYLRTGDSIEGHLACIKENFVIESGETVYQFIFAQEVKDEPNKA
jgi:hypothetical protein